jgi:Methyltransferase domain
MLLPAVEDVEDAAHHIHRVHLPQRPPLLLQFRKTHRFCGRGLQSSPPQILLKKVSAMSFTMHTIYRQIFKLWRQRRFQLFVTLMKPYARDTLLDVGGYPGSWTSHPQHVQRIDTLNVDEDSWSALGTRDYNIRTLIGDGCSLPMTAQSYDIGYSNSVIEHVGSWERQQRFASEIRRVAKAVWVQTPAFECPIEPHYMTPFIHYLPHRVQKRILRWWSLWGWIERPDHEQIDSVVETTRLLRKSEMQQLFPDCEILTERMLWVFPKSYIAIRRKA